MHSILHVIREFTVQVLKDNWIFWEKSW